MKTQKSNSKEHNKFSEGYKKITENGNSTYIATNKEWHKKGDYFKKFSLYNNYTPVKTSSKTTLTDY